MDNEQTTRSTKDTFFTQATCDRCGGRLESGRTMSRFNRDCICMECAAKERARGDYPLAVAVEREAVKRGIRDYPGIGLCEWASESLRTILPITQRRFLDSLLRSGSEDTRREATAMVEAAEQQAKAFETMPKTGETDGQPESRVKAHLHYFVPTRTADWWITERDADGRQIQAFGLARLWETELGYINLEELQALPLVELDFYWKPTTLQAVRESIGDEMRGGVI